MMALADALQILLRLPGATYACVVERDSGWVLAELGPGEAGAGDSEGVVPYSVPRWGAAVAAMFDSTSGDELDDVMITGRRSYHLVRPLDAGAGVLAYLRLDRARSNLAVARRELAAVRLSAGPAAATPRTGDLAPPGSGRSTAAPPRPAAHSGARGAGLSGWPGAEPAAGRGGAADPPAAPGTRGGGRSGGRGGRTCARLGRDGRRAPARGVRRARRPRAGLGPGSGHAPSPARGSAQDAVTNSSLCVSILLRRVGKSPETATRFDAP